MTFQQFKYTITNNWNFMRFLRIAMGIFLIFQAIETGQYVFFAFAAFFIFQAIFNLGCSGESCGVQYKNDVKRDEK